MYDGLLECLQVTYTDAIAMAMPMAMTSRELTPLSMPLSPDEAHTMIGDCTKIIVSNTDND
jgi:hypothetical protein